MTKEPAQVLEFDDQSDEQDVPEQLKPGTVFGRCDQSSDEYVASQLTNERIIKRTPARDHKVRSTKGSELKI